MAVQRPSRLWHGEAIGIPDYRGWVAASGLGRTRQYTKTLSENDRDRVRTKQGAFDQKCGADVALEVSVLTGGYGEVWREDRTWRALSMRQTDPAKVPCCVAAQAASRTSGKSVYRQLAYTVVLVQPLDFIP